jgi:ferrochelatase
MKHSPPFIADAVEAMRSDGIERAVGIVMAPHWSGMSVETYIERVREAAGDGPPRFAFVRSFHDGPAFVSFLAGRLRRALGAIPDGVRDATTVVFSAHSLPVRSLEDGSERCKYCRADACATACRYQRGLTETARLVAGEAGVGDWTTAWQSAGRTADPWWGPPIETVIEELAAAGRKGVIVCSAGFVADHLEILYDLDIEARGLAEDAGLAFARTDMPNADPAFVSLLANVVRRTIGAEEPA